MSALLEVDQLEVGFGSRTSAVRGTSLTVERGETHCLVGESGCGKSVTALADHEPAGRAARSARRTAPALRRARTCGRSTTRGMSRLRGNRMAMIFQEPMTSLNPAYTVGSQMTEVLRRHKGASQRVATDRAADLLARVGITAPGLRLGQFPHQLSGGLRQRVMIAMALMCDPQLLIADEPTTALDVTVQAQILRLLAELQRDLGLGMLLITHDLGIVARVATASRSCTRARWSRARRPPQLFADPKHPYTQRPAALRAGAGQDAARRAAGLDPRHGAAHRPGLRGLRLPRPLRLRRRQPAPHRSRARHAAPGHDYLCRLAGMERAAA